MTITIDPRSETTGDARPEAREGTEADGGRRRREEALKLLCAIQPPPARGEFIEVRRMAPEERTGRSFYRSAFQLLSAQDAYREWYNIYFGPALRRGRRGKAADVSRCATLWADVDAKLWAREPDPKGAALAAIAAFPLRPTAVVDSGGGYQPYWALDRPFLFDTGADRERFERVNAALARALCGPERRPDSVQDVARVLRLPGTLNHKPAYGAPRPVRVVWCEPTRRYTLADLERDLSERYAWALVPPAPPAWLDPEPWDDEGVDLESARARLARARLRSATRALLDSTGPAAYRSASEADAAIAAALVAAGLTAAEAYALILDSPRGQDAFARKGAEHAETYWRRTVTHAAGFVGPVEERPDGLRVRRVGGGRRPFKTKSTKEVGR
jgi:hypothetical protein